MNFGINTTTHYTAVKTDIPEPSPTTSQTQKATEGHMQNNTIYTRFKNMQNYTICCLGIHMDLAKL